MPDPTPAGRSVQVLAAAYGARQCMAVIALIVLYKIANFTDAGKGFRYLVHHRHDQIPAACGEA